MEIVTDVHEPVPIPVPLPSSSHPPLRTLAAITAPGPRRLWHAALDAMALLPGARPEQLALIRQWITTGVSLQFVSDPSPIDHDNTFAVHENASAVRQRIGEYVAFEALTPLPADHPCPYGVQPLHVIIKAGRKPRLVIDLSRNLNEHLEYEYFSYASVLDAVERSFPGCWFGKLDLSNCFLSFPLDPSVLPHFVFRFEGQLYQFLRMPFGLSVAPRICTLLLSVVGHGLQQAGVDAAARYLDDFLFLQAEESLMQHSLRRAEAVISAFGLVVNPDKTEGPAQRIAFLGIMLDSVQQTLSCTPERLEELRHLLSHAESSAAIKLTALETLIGKLSFATQVLPGARPFMRRMMDLLHGRLRSLALTERSGPRHAAKTTAKPATDLRVSASDLRVTAAAAADLRVSAASAAKTTAKLATDLRVSAADLRVSAAAAAGLRAPAADLRVHDLRVLSTAAADPRVAAARRRHFATTNATVRIDRGFRADARFWLRHLHRWDGSQRWRSARSAPFAFVSDASLQGFGFYLEAAPPHATPADWPAHLRPGSGFMGGYSPEDARHHAESGHMTWCELFAVFAALHTYHHVLRDSCALFVLDNLPDVHALNRQSTGSRRNAGLLREVYAIAVAFNIAVSAEHRPGVDNVLADFLSRPSLHGDPDVVRAWRLAHPDDAARLVSVSHVFSRDFGGTRARPS